MLPLKHGGHPSSTNYRCERITAGVTRALVGERPIKVMLDPYNSTGSTMHVNFTTSKTERWETDPRRCHVNWAILDSGWEGEFCRVAESHSRVLAYVKNHNLGLEVPYLYGSEPRKYIPDFVVLVDDGHGENDPLHLIVEIKGYRGEDAKEKKATMENYWIPGVNNHGAYGRWAFAEFTEVYQIESEFGRMIEDAVVDKAELGRMVENFTEGEELRDLTERESAHYLARLGGSDPGLQPIPRRRPESP